MSVCFGDLGVIAGYVCEDAKQTDRVLLLCIVNEGQKKSTRSAYSGAESYTVHHVRSGLLWSFLTLTILSFKNECKQKLIPKNLLPLIQPKYFTLIKIKMYNSGVTSGDIC